MRWINRIILEKKQKEQLKIAIQVINNKEPLILAILDLVRLMGLL